MVDQATVNRGNPASKLGRNVSGYAHDLLTLGELQLRLFAVDLRDGSKTAGMGLGAIVAGVLAALGAIPLIFVTIALALVEFADWSWTASFGVSALLGLIVGAAAAWFGWKRVIAAGKTFGRSKAEAVETLRWVKESLRPTEPDPVPGPSSRF
jgi:MFS family permease